MMFSVDPGGNTLEIPVGKDWQSDETFEVEAVLIRIDVQGRQTIPSGSMRATGGGARLRRSKRATRMATNTSIR